MNSKKQPNYNLHPYIFALEAGEKIDENLLDYSLLLVHRNCSEVIRSPKNFDLALVKEKLNLEAFSNQESNLLTP